jgi:hypothetical protein
MPKRRPKTPAEPGPSLVFAIQQAVALAVRKELIHMARLLAQAGDNLAPTEVRRHATPAQLAALAKARAVRAAKRKRRS